MKRRVAAAVIVLVALATMGVVRAEPERVVVFVQSWFQARGYAFTNIVVIPYEGATANSLAEALEQRNAVKLTIQGDEFLAEGDSFTATMDIDKRRLTLDYWDKKGKQKTKRFTLFNRGWTAPDQLR